MVSTERKKLRVMFISSWYPNRNSLSHGIFIKRHAEAVALFHTISVIHVCADRNVKKGNFESEEIIENNVHSVIVYYKKIDFSFPFISQFLKFYRFIKAHFIAYKTVVKKTGKPDLLHLHVIYKAGLAALIFKKLYNLPLLTSEHWSGYLPDDGSYKGFFKKLITRLSVKNSKVVIVISEKMKESMLRHKLYNNYVNIPNVVNTQLFKPLDHKEGKSSKIRIIHVSSINDREKNISGILRTIKQLSSQREDFVLNVIGFSPENENFEKMAMNMGILNKNVFFRGWKNENETAEYMRKSDFFLMFSNYEGLPCVLIESLACGLPVIATNTGGIPEIVTKEQGMLVPVNNEVELLKAINEMLNSFNNYNPQDLSKYAEQNFSYEITAGKISDIYQKAIIKA